ncbi:MAG: SHOCT domain-containing protein [Nitrospiraceae bacterium]|nr:SHOCT domain-containing protein [Nitrospiraceae bacterium]
MMGNGMMYGPSGGGMWMFFHFLFWTLVVIGAILLIVWIVRQAERRTGDHAEETALNILKKRYTRGEITKEEYDKVKKDIS